MLRQIESLEMTYNCRLFILLDTRSNRSREWGEGDTPVAVVRRAVFIPNAVINRDGEYGRKRLLGSDFKLSA